MLLVRYSTKTLLAWVALICIFLTLCVNWRWFVPMRNGDIVVKTAVLSNGGREAFVDVWTGNYIQIELLVCKSSETSDSLDDLAVYRKRIDSQNGLGGNRRAAATIRLAGGNLVVTHPGQELPFTVPIGVTHDTDRKPRLGQLIPMSGAYYAPGVSGWKKLVSVVWSPEKQLDSLWDVYFRVNSVHPKE